MKNIDMHVDGNVMTLVVQLNQPMGPSSSGKTILLASTEGNLPVPGHPGVEFGVNVYKPKPGRKK